MTSSNPKSSASRQVFPYKHTLLIGWSQIYEPILIAGPDKFSNVDIRVRVSGGGRVSQIYAIRYIFLHKVPANLLSQAISKAIIAYYQKYVDEQSKIELKKTLVSYDRTLLVADPRRCEPKKFGGKGARSKYQKVTFIQEKGLHQTNFESVIPLGFLYSLHSHFITNLNTYILFFEYTSKVYGLAARLSAL